MTHLRTALALALVVGTASAQRPADDPIQLVAHCTFERDGVAMLGMLCGSGARPGIRALFIKHALSHGWREKADEPDFVDSAHSVACPAWLLDQMAGFGGFACSGGDVFLDRAVADVLARNRRVDDALRILRSAIDDTKLGNRRHASTFFYEYAEEAEWTQEDASDVASHLSEWAACSAARAGLWNRALDFAKDWEPTSSCCIGARIEADRIRIFRARCLMGLSRYAEAIALAREPATDLGKCGGATAELIALWIDCLIADHRARNAESALAAILSEIPVQVHGTCREGLRCWQLAHMSREEQLTHLVELADIDPDRALELLLASNSLAIVAQLDALDAVDRARRHPALARVLAKTGHPDVGIALQKGPSPDPLFDFELVLWSRARARWNAVAVMR